MGLERTRASAARSSSQSGSRTGGRSAGPRLPGQSFSHAGLSQQIPRSAQAHSATVGARQQAAHRIADSDLCARLRYAYDREVARGLRILLAAVCVGGALACLVPLSGAVAVSGSVVSASDPQKVQHPVGGVVDEILVHDGAHVRRGDIVARMNEVAARSALAGVETQLDQVRARIARLVAERDQLAQPDWPPELLMRARVHAHVADLIASEQAQFEARGSAYAKQIEILKQRVAQLEEEQAGYQAQALANEKQHKYVRMELEGLEDLYKQQLVALPRLSSVAREAARLEGERGQLAATIAEHASKIQETNLQINAVAQARRVELTKDITEAHGQESELAERCSAAKDAADRVEIRAPQSGIVHQLSVHTAGGVIAPGETIMLIAPDDGDLLAEARLPPQEIDQVFVGQPARVRFSAFDRATTPELHGAVVYVSPDVARSPQSDATYYAVRIALPGNELHRLGNLALRPGMPAEIFLETESRTIASYLFKPFSDQMPKMLRER